MYWQRCGNSWRNANAWTSFSDLLDIVWLCWWYVGDAFVFCWCVGHVLVNLRRWFCHALVMCWWSCRYFSTMIWRCGGVADIYELAMYYLWVRDVLEMLMHYKVFVVLEWCVDDNLAMRWWCVGNVLVMFWRVGGLWLRWWIGDVLALGWHACTVPRCSSDVLAKRWCSGRKTLVIVWRVGFDVLAMCGRYVDNTLVILCWCGDNVLVMCRYCFVFF